eukprot:g992.t1
MDNPNVKKTLAELAQQKIGPVDDKLYASVISNEKKCRAGNESACSKLFAGYVKLCLDGGVGAMCYQAGEMVRTAPFPTADSKDTVVVDTDAEKPYRNPSRAFDLYSRACSKSHLRACYEKALMMASGVYAKEGVPKDRNGGVALLEKNCDRGHTDSCLTLANAAFSKKRRTKHDARRAEVFFAKACNLGNPVSCYNLGLMHKHGVGMDKTDMIFAWQCLNRACRRGVEEACIAADKTEGEMSEDEKKKLLQQIQETTSALQVGEDTDKTKHK